VNEIRLKSIFQLSSHMKSAKFMARGLVTEKIFSLVLMSIKLDFTQLLCNSELIPLIFSHSIIMKHAIWSTSTNSGYN
jgi:hypothetical protein